MKNQLGSSFLISSILREAKRISEDHTLVLSLLLAPIFYAFFYGSIYLNKTEEEVEIVVVDQSRSELSRTFYRMVDETPEVNVVLSTQDFQKAKKMYLLGEVQAVVVIPSSFEKDLKKLHATDVGLFLNTSRFLPSNDVNATVNKVALLLGAGVRLQYFELHGDNESLSITKAQPITMHDKTVFVTPSTYGGFLLPGLLLLILQQTFLIGLAESTAREREFKTFKEWMQLGNYSAIKAIWGKGFFFLILYGAYSLFFHVVNYHVLQLPVKGNTLDLTVLLSLFFMVLLPFGIFFGSLFKREIWALQFFAFSSYPIFLLSGYSWPVYAMNPTLQFVAALIPTTPMLEAYGALVFKDASLYQVVPQITHLLLLGIAYLGLAHFQLKRLSKLS